MSSSSTITSPRLTPMRKSIRLSNGIAALRSAIDNEMIRDIVLAVMSSLAKQERLRHVERVHAGIARARIKGTQSGKPIGRPWIDKRKEAAIRAELTKGTGILKTARLCKVGTGTVQRIKREMTRAS